MQVFFFSLLATASGESSQPPSAEERIGAVAQLLSAHSEAVGERFAATAKALATNGELTPLKLAQLAAAQLVNPLPKMELEEPAALRRRVLQKKRL